MFTHFDFQQLESPDFKEDSVREVLILPILQKLGYDYKSIVRSKTLKHPFVKIGSKKRAVNLVPDYLLKVQDNFAWVLDAKSPTENVQDSDHIEQVYSYAIHPEVRTKFFTLCNGREFILFRQDHAEPLLYFPLQDIENHWDKLQKFLAPDAFQSGKKFTYTTTKKAKISQDFEYLNRPLLEEIKVRKQAAKRHFGVHGYFTKQAWNVVQEYIRNFSQKGDLVLDSFGGSGVTAVEALMIGRKAIHLDLNPMSAFMVEALTAPITVKALQREFEKIKTEFAKNSPQTKTEIQEVLKKYPYPTGFQLPKSADVDTIEQLFTDKQLAQLAFLKYLILKIRNKNIQKSLLLAFSSTVNKFNQTFHFTPKKIKDKKGKVIKLDYSKSAGGGDSAVFRYYRYRIAPQPADLELLPIFETKVKKIINAKKEIAHAINSDTIKNIDIQLRFFEK